MNNDALSGSHKSRVDFDAPATLRKWPSLGNQRRGEAVSPYLVLNGTLEECLRKLMAYTASTRHLYEIHTAPQPPLVQEVMTVILSSNSIGSAILECPRGAWATLPPQISPQPPSGPGSASIVCSRAVVHSGLAESASACTVASTKMRRNPTPSTC